MRINPNLFENGKIRLGTGYPTDVKWHPLYAEDEGYHFIAASYSTGEIKLFQVNEKDGGKRVELRHERSYVADNYLECKCLDWSPDGHCIVAGYRDGTIKMFDLFTNKMVKSFCAEDIDEYQTVNSINFSPDGQYFVLRFRDAIRLWDTITGNEIYDFYGKEFTTVVNFANFSTDGRFIVSGSFKTINLWDTITGMEVIAFEKYRCNPFSGSFSPDGRFIVVGYDWDHDTYPNKVSQILKLWDTTTGKEVSAFFKGETHVASINSVSFSQDGRFVVSGSKDKTIKCWEAATGKEVKGFNGKGHINIVISVSYSPDGRFIVSASFDGSLKIWNLTTGTEVGSFNGKGHKHSVNSVCFSPDGRFIASASLDNTVKLWNTATAEEVNRFNDKSHTKTGIYVNFSPDGKSIITSSDDEYTKRWDVSTGNEVLNEFLDVGNFGGTNFSPGEANFSPDGRFIVSGQSAGTMVIHDAATFNYVSDINCMCYVEDSLAYPDTIYSLSPDGQYGVCAQRSTLVLFDITKGRKVTDFRDYGESYELIETVCFSPDGKYIATSGNPYIISLWDSITLKIVEDFKVDICWITSPCFSPDGRFIIFCSNDMNCNKLVLCEVATGDVYYEICHTGSINYVSCSPNGRFVVSGSDDNTILIWNLEQILGKSWLKEHLSSPLILTGVWFPDKLLRYMKETKQINIVDNRPIARCGECGLFFTVEDRMRGKEMRCPNDTMSGKCNRLVKLNEFTAGVER